MSSFPHIHFRGAYCLANRRHRRYDEGEISTGRLWFPMGKSKTRSIRTEAERADRYHPATDRRQWQRKPFTQIQPNRKAEQRRLQCRNRGNRNGADFFVRFSDYRK